MTVNLELSADDLSQVVFSPRPSALHEINIVAQKLAASPAAQRGAPLDREKLSLALGVLGRTTPSFLHGAPPGIDEALGHLMELDPSVFDVGFREIVELGRRLPAWTCDLARGERHSRNAMVKAFRHIYDVGVAPSAGFLQSLLEAEATRWTTLSATEGLGTVLDSLHPMVRWDAPVLRNELVWGQGGSVQQRGDRVVSARGRGLRLVPSAYASRPTIDIPEWERRPIILYFPVDLARVAARAGRSGSEGGGTALARLLGASRARLLRHILERPGLGTRDLARFSDLSAASVSEHTDVLRQSGLISTHRQGAAVAHHPVPLAWRLVAAASEPPSSATASPPQTRRRDRG